MVVGGGGGPFLWSAPRRRAGPGRRPWAKISCSAAAPVRRQATMRGRASPSASASAGPGEPSGVDDALSQIDELLRHADEAVDVLLKSRLADLRKKYVETMRMERAVQLELIRCYSQSDLRLSKLRRVEEAGVRFLRDARAASETAAAASTEDGADGVGAGAGSVEASALELLEIVYRGDDSFKLISSKERARGGLGPAWTDAPGDEDAGVRCPAPAMDASERV